MPDWPGRTDGQLLLEADQGNPQQQRILHQSFEPALRGMPAGVEAQLSEATPAAVEERFNPEFLHEAGQLSGGGGPLQQVNEMDLDPAFRKEPERGAGVGAFFDAENLNLHETQLPKSLAGNLAVARPPREP